MGERCDLFIVDESGEYVDLYAHWLGYPAYMTEFILEAYDFAKKLAGKQKHWLSYPEDVASYLIGYEAFSDHERLEKKLKGEYPFSIHLDLRPRGRIRDNDERLYILRVSEEKWILEYYEVPDSYDRLEDYKEKVLIFRLEMGKEIKFEEGNPEEIVDRLAKWRMYSEEGKRKEIEYYRKKLEEIKEVIRKFCVKKALS